MSEKLLAANLFEPNQAEQEATIPEVLLATARPKLEVSAVEAEFGTSKWFFESAYSEPFKPYLEAFKKLLRRRPELEGESENVLFSSLQYNDLFLQPLEFKPRCDIKIPLGNSPGASLGRALERRSLTEIVNGDSVHLQLEFAKVQTVYSGNKSTLFKTFRYYFVTAFPDVIYSIALYPYTWVLLVREWGMPIKEALQDGGPTISALRFEVLHNVLSRFTAYDCPTVMSLFPGATPEEIYKELIPGNIIDSAPPGLKLPPDQAKIITNHWLKGHSLSDALLLDPLAQIGRAHV